MALERSMIRFLFIITLLISTSETIANEFELAEHSRLNGAHELAVKLYEQAAKNGNALASHWAGTYYFNGIEIKQDLVKAYEYFLYAAENEIDGSMIYLANMYLSGQGVKVDCEQAYKWISKSLGTEIPKAWKIRISGCKSH